jgi:guanylate kinase
MKQPIMIFGSIITAAVIIFLAYAAFELHKTRLAQEGQARQQSIQSGLQQQQLIMQSINSALH